MVGERCILRDLTNEYTSSDCRTYCSHNDVCMVMDFTYPTKRMNIHKIIIGNKFLRYTPFWCWYRLIIHNENRFLYQDFWNSINEGYSKMVEDGKWLTYFGAKPETIYVSREAYDELVRRINEPPDPKVMERFREILNRKAPWDDN